MTRLRWWSTEKDFTWRHILCRFLPAVSARSGLPEPRHRQSLHPDSGGHWPEPRSGGQGSGCPHQAQLATLLRPGYLPEYAPWVIRYNSSDLPSPECLPPVFTMNDKWKPRQPTVLSPQSLSRYALWIINYQAQLATYIDPVVYPDMHCE